MSGKPAVSPSVAVSAAPSRLLILESLVPIAVDQVGLQMAAFTERLAQVLFRLSDQSVLPTEASLSADSWHHLKKNRSRLHRGVLASLGQALLCEIAALDTAQAMATDAMSSTLLPMSPEQMETRILTGNLAQSIELDHATAFLALNLRLSRLLQREEISIALNPFRPAVFVRAVHAAWCTLQPHAAAQRLVLRILRADVLFDFGPILDALNQALIARGIVPDMAGVIPPARLRHAKPVLPGPTGFPDGGWRDDALPKRLQRWLHHDTGSPHDAALMLASTPSVALDAPVASPARQALLTQLTGLQCHCDKEEAPHGHSTALLRDIARQAPAGSLSAVEQNTIELLARMFDVWFDEVALPDRVKCWLGRLQLPLLKVALSDQEFFSCASAPVRRFLDQLMRCGMALQCDIAADDPLCHLIDRIVERVRHDDEQLPVVYRHALAELESFMADALRAEKIALAPYIAQALREERMQQAQLAAEKDVASRIESGAVAGFVELFLETQWTRILARAHSIATRKPEALEKARTAMDDLIWSIQPKASAEERREMIGKLPSLLSLIHAWLNAIRWDEPARGLFFSSLAERHLAIVRGAPGLSPRRQIEMAVNIAQKASDRRLSRRAREMQQQPIDQFVHTVDSIEPGRWVDFVRADGERTARRLAWISPQRTRFVFTHRPGGETLVSTLTDTELAAALRDQGALVLPGESAVARALAAALDGAELAGSQWPGGCSCSKIHSKIGTPA